MRYTFVVGHAKSLRSCPVVHLVTCPMVRQIINPTRIFDAEGLNAMAALEAHERGRSLHTPPAEPGRCCLVPHLRGEPR